MLLPERLGLHSASSNGMPTGRPYVVAGVATALVLRNARPAPSGRSASLARSCSTAFVWI